MNAKGLSAKLEKLYDPFANGIPSEMKKHIIGAEDFIRMLLITLLAGSGHRTDEKAPEYHAHILSQGGVGSGKTTICSKLAETIDGASFSRIQFTRDLKPLSLKRTVEQTEDGMIRFFRGPLNANIVLADEVTRAGDPVHSAMIEPMAEGILVTPSVTYRTPRPYMVVATANPWDIRGVVARLGNAFSDRFTFEIDSPQYTKEERLEIMLGQELRAKKKIEKMVSIEDVLTARDLIHEEIVVDIKVARSIERITELARIRFTDDKNFSKHGAEGERPALWFVRAGKARAFLERRSYVAQEDIVKLGYPILRHRIDLGFGVSNAEKEKRIKEIIYEVLMENAGIS